jgi:hypothetical protein
MTGKMNTQSNRYQSTYSNNTLCTKQSGSSEFQVQGELCALCSVQAYLMLRVCEVRTAGGLFAFI